MRTPALELASFDDGTLLVNLESGTYFEINAAAAEICQLLRAGAAEGEIVSRLVERHGLSVLDAHRAMAAVTEALNDPAPAAEPVGPLRYRRTDWGYAFWCDGAPVVETRADGAALRLVGERRAQPDVVEGWLRCLAAKILSLQNVPVLHASACGFGDGVVAICGQSGAGKTTTARALAGAGRPLHAEDMVVLELGEKVQVHVEGERALRAWAARTRAELAAAPSAIVDCRELPALVRTPALRPLERVLFLDRTRRRGREIVAEPIRRIECLAELLQSSFLGSSEPEAWRAFIAANAVVARAVSGARVSVPDGLDALAAAAARFDPASPPRAPDAR